MSQYPTENYRIGQFSAGNIAKIQGNTNAGQLAECFDLSSFITFNILTIYKLSTTKEVSPLCAAMMA